MVFLFAPIKHHLTKQNCCWFSVLSDFFSFLISIVTCWSFPFLFFLHVVCISSHQLCSHKGCICFLNWQVWAWILLLLWCRIQGRNSDLSLCILGWAEHRILCFTVESGIRNVGLGFFWYFGNGHWRVLRTRKSTAGSNSKVPCRRIQPKWPPPLPVTTSLFRLIHWHHERPPPATMAWEVCLGD